MAIKKFEASAPARTSWSRHASALWGDLRRGPLTVAVWLAAVTGVCVLFQHRTQRFECLGIARGIQYEISAPVDGRLAKVAVELLAEVNAGQVVARLDDHLLEAKVRTAGAAINQFKAELQAERAKLASDEQDRSSDWRSRLGEFHADEDKLRLDALNVKVTLESDRLELERVKLELERADRLLAAEAGDRPTRDQFKAQHDQLARRIEENMALLARTQEALGEAQARREAFAGEHPERAGEEAAAEAMISPMREAVRQQELLLEELRVEREATILRAPAAGRVTQILCQDGQSVELGEPIVMISSLEAAEVVGYVAEGLGEAPLRERMRVQVARASRPEQISEALVTRVSPAVEELPLRLWRDPRQPEYGRTFVATAAAPLALSPGERLLIRFAH